MQQNKPIPLLYEILYDCWHSQKTKEEIGDKIHAFFQQLDFETREENVAKAFKHWRDQENETE